MYIFEIVREDKEEIKKSMMKIIITENYT